MTAPGAPAGPPGGPAKGGRTGRPPKPKGEAREATLSLRLTDADREAVRAAAEAAGVSESEWIRQALVAALATRPKASK